MNTFNTILHYACINLIFIDCLINAVYIKENSIHSLTLFINALKILLYIWLGIYSYVQDWYIGILVSMFTCIIGLYHLTYISLVYSKKTAM